MLKELEEMYKYKDEEGTFRVQDNDTLVYIANFYPKVIRVQDTSEGKEVVININFVSGLESEITIPVSKVDRINWFQLDTRCLVDDNKNAQRYLKQLLRMQIANYENEVAKITQYTQLGWNTNAYGNAVYVAGNLCIGGNGNEIVSPALAEYQLQFDKENSDYMLQEFCQLFYESDKEVSISILYFFTGLIRQLYKDAGIPVDFVLYIFGEQQNRKTTLARLTNNLYNRDTDMDFSVRTVAKTSCATTEKLISIFKDTTLILDDVSLTGDKRYRQNQENIMESVVRMLGNRARKSSNSGNGTKEYFPNSNVVITGEYLPRFSQSTLSRMMIIEVKRPVDSVWLETFERYPLMLSTVAYKFISWIQSDYNKCVHNIYNNFELYCRQRSQKRNGQERISQHGFIMLCTSCILQSFFAENGYNEYDFRSKNGLEIKKLCKKQEVLMRELALKSGDKDFCRTFVDLYMTKKLNIADDKVTHFWRKMAFDGFIYNKHTICISTAVLCEKMRSYYKDTSITIQSITKQLRGNCFLITDNSKSSKSTKKVGSERYLHISLEAVEDYYKYCCQ